MKNFTREWSMEDKLAHRKQALDYKYNRENKNDSTVSGQSRKSLRTNIINSSATHLCNG